MKEIKSFREYIAEQELLKEGDEILNDKIYNEKYGNKPKEQAPDDSDTSDGETDNSNNTKTVPTPDQLSKEGITLSVTNNFKPTFSGNSKAMAKLAELSRKHSVLRDTFDNLHNIVVAAKLDSNKRDSSAPEDDQKDNPPKQTVLNLTHGKSLTQIYNEYFPLIEAAAKELKKSAQPKKDAEKYGNPFTSRIKADDAYKKQHPEKESDDTEPETKENEKATNESVEVFEAFDILKARLDAARARRRENLGYNIRSLNRPFKSSSTLSSDYGNKHGAGKILNQIEDDFKDYEQKMEDAYKSFDKDSIALINKRAVYIKRYLDAAEKVIKYCKNTKRYLRDEDEKLDEAQGYLNTAYKELLTLGGELENKMYGFENSLKRVLKELRARTRKNNEFSDSINADIAERRYKTRARIEDKAKEIAADTYKVGKEKVSSTVSKLTQKAQERQERKEQIEAEKKKYVEPVKKIAIKKAKDNINNKTYKPENNIEQLLKDFEDESKYSKVSNGLKQDRLKEADALSILTYILAQDKIKKVRGKGQGRSETEENEILQKAFKNALESSKGGEDPYETLRIAKSILEAKKAPYKRTSTNSEDVENKKTRRKLGVFRKNKTKNNIVNQKTGTYDGNAKKFDGVKPLPAKDFPQENMSIYDYAIQKAQANK